MNRMYDLGINHKLPSKVKQEFHILFDNTEEGGLTKGSDEPGIILVDKSHIEKLVDRELIMNRLRMHDPFFENLIDDKSVDTRDKKPRVNFDEDIQYGITPPMIPDESDSGEEEEDEEEGEQEEGEQEGEEEEGALLVPIDISDKKGRNKKKNNKKKKDGEPEDTSNTVDLSRVKLGESLAISRLPPMKPIKIRSSPIYMTNRTMYIQKLAKMFQPFREKMAQSESNISCDTNIAPGANMDLFIHQQVVRDYLNLYTPYRGLLLYHGLGSGKTCTSIAIAEGMKSNKEIVLMTPASLKMNFFSELKKCGDVMYKKNQFWEFITIEGQPQNVPILAKALNLPEKYIRSGKGAWMVDVSKPANFANLSPKDQKSVDLQLNEMIRMKYYDINYNGLNNRKLEEMTKKKSINPFDNKVVIIDEAHNFVSRITNKLNKKTSISYVLYNYLMDATNAKIILLTGTPIINYPHEIGILFNILRGYIKTWSTSVVTTTTDKITRDSLLDLFTKNGLNTYDYVEYSGNNLTVTRNPFGFVNKYKRERKEHAPHESRPLKEDVEKKRTTKKKSERNGGKRRTKRNKTEEKNTDYHEISKNVVAMSHREYPELDYDETMDYHYKRMGDLQKGGENEFRDYVGVQLDETGNMSDTQFQRELLRILNKAGIKPVGEMKVTKNLVLPDEADKFNDMFINPDNGNVIHIDLFQRRILGLTSYFRSAQEKLLPSFIQTADKENYHIVRVPMSDYQFSVYEKIRKSERDQEASNKKRKRAKKGKEEEDVSSTYRIFSRSACNFAFPANQTRPLPDKDAHEINEEQYNGITRAMKKNLDDFMDDEDDDEELVEEESKVADYQQRIKDAMDFLRYDPMRQREEEYLTKQALDIYSPKFASVLANLTNEENRGLHLLYSQFRTIEGIGLLKLILEANGYAEFKIARMTDSDGGTTWDIVEREEDADKPKFVLYTGTEIAEEKEIIRNIYNSSWEFVPSNIVLKMKERSPNNYYGEIVKILMITSSGAEGINLQNTRFVHVVEPYWNMVRVDQVVGRARRICSHKFLPEEMRTVKVFIYLSILSEEQKIKGKNQELFIQDVSKIDKKTPFTTDETLFEISNIKDRTNRQILNAVKESAIDCSIYNTSGTEPLVCYQFGKVQSNDFSSHPVLEKDVDRPIEQVKNIKLRIVDIYDNGKKYALNPKTGEVFSWESYEDYKRMGTNLIQVGKIVETMVKTNGRMQKITNIAFV